MKKEIKACSYIHYDADYGTVTCSSTGSIRDMFEDGLHGRELPSEVDKAVQDLCKAIYLETGNLTSIDIRD